MNVVIYKRVAGSQSIFHAAILDEGRKIEDIGPYKTRQEAEIESCYREKELQDA